MTKRDDYSSSPLAVVTDVSAIPMALAGAGQYTWSLIAELGRRTDVHLDLVTRRSDADRWRQVAPRSSVAAVSPDATPTRIVYGELALARVVARRFPSAEVFFGPHYTIPTRLRLPAVVTVHDLTLVDNPEWHEPVKAFYFRAALRRAAKLAKVLVCVSERTAVLVSERFHSSANIVVVPHGIDHNRFSPNEPSSGSDEATLKRLGVNEPFVLHVGTIEPRKNLPGLIAAFDAVAGEHRQLSLVLVGSHAWGSHATQRARANVRHRDRIISLGYVDDNDVPALLRRAAAVAYPSFAEGFGLPALEALACGAPLVTSIDTVMSDVANGAAILVDPSDPKAIAAGIDEALRDSDSTQTRRRDGFAIASGYTWERSAVGHLAAFAAAGQ